MPARTIGASPPDKVRLQPGHDQQRDWCGHMALSQIKRTGEQRAGLAAGGLDARVGQSGREPFGRNTGGPVPQHRCAS
jgi:hypothetical protein